MKRTPFLRVVGWSAVSGWVLPVLLMMGWSAGGARAQVYVQDSPAAAELLTDAKDRLGQDEPAEAAELIQRIIEAYGSKLLRIEGERYAEARRVVENLLRGNEPLRSVYQRLYGPQALRMLREAGSDRVKLTALTDRFALTDAGLRASLRLAGLALEAGDADDAALLLSGVSEHPRLSAQRTRWLRLRAAVARLRGDEQRGRRIREALSEASADEALADLDRFADSLQPRRTGRRWLNPLRTLPRAAPPDQVDSPLWSYPMDGVERFLLDTYRGGSEDIENRAEDGRYLNTLPVVGGSLVYVSDGWNVHALEPSGGLEVWRRRILERDATDLGLGRYSRHLPRGADLSMLAGSGDRVVATCGFGAMVSRYPFYRGRTVSALACLDADDGRVLWSHRPAEIADDLDDAFWYGRPIISGGRVYATIRRRQRTRFQDCYVAALDLESGELLWRRHLASTPVVDRQNVPAMPPMTLANGRLYVDSGLGTVARLSTRNGAVDWLAVPAADPGDGEAAIHRPWQASPPVLVAGKLVMLDRRRGRVRVFDPGSGEPRRTIPAEQWGSPLYLLSWKDKVLAVGDQVRLYDGATLEERWAYDPEAPPRGRASLTADRLYLPVEGQVRVIDVAEGTLRERMDVKTPANLLALDGRLVAAGRDGLRGYSSWKVASKALRRRAENHPDDPRPLMAVAWLAFKTRRTEALLGALDRAIGRIGGADADETFREELFDQVLTMARGNEDEAKLDRGVRGELFNRLAVVANGPADEVDYRLARASFQEAMDRPAEAVEQYQTILEEPTYRRQLYEHQSGARQAELEARRRLSRLLERRGRQWYEPYEAFARRRLEELRDQGDPKPLIELANAYPLASTVAEALELAAERAARRGRARDALPLLRRAAEQTRDAAERAKIYGRRVELLEKTRQPQRARRVLRSLIAAHPSVRPLRGGAPTDARSWLNQLRDQPGTGDGTRLNLPISSAARVLEGRFLRPLNRKDRVDPASFLLRTSSHLERRRADDLSRVWRRPIEHDDLQLLASRRERVWLWSPGARQFQVLDAATGELRWQEGVAQKFAAIEAPEAEEARNEQEARFRRMIVVGVRRESQEETDTMVAVGGGAAAAADPRGRLVVFDAGNGKVLWQGVGPVRNASHLMLENGRLVLAGLDTDRVPILCVYDARSGELLHQILSPDQEAISWAGLTRRGRLVYATDSRIESFDLDRGESVWIYQPSEEIAGERAWVGPRRLVVRDRRGDLLWIDLDSGEPVRRLTVRGALKEPLRITPAADAWFLVDENRVIAVDDAGQPIWRDAVSGAPPFVAHRLTDRYLMLLAASEDARAGGADQPMLYALDRQTGIIRYQHRLLTPQPLDQMRVMDGKLLIGGGETTAVLGGSP